MQYIKVIHPGTPTCWHHNKVGQIFKVDETVSFPFRYAIRFKKSGTWGIIDYREAVDVTPGIRKNILAARVIIITIFILSLITSLING